MASLGGEWGGQRRRAVEPLPVEEAEKYWKYRGEHFVKYAIV